MKIYYINIFEQYELIYIIIKDNNNMNKHMNSIVEKLLLLK
jgi:hypothetical protein